MLWNVAILQETQKLNAHINTVMHTAYRGRQSVHTKGGKVHTQRGVRALTQRGEEAHTQRGYIARALIFIAMDTRNGGFFWGRKNGYSSIQRAKMVINL